MPAAVAVVGTVELVALDAVVLNEAIEVDNCKLAIIIADCSSSILVRSRTSKSDFRLPCGRPSPR